MVALKVAARTRPSVDQAILDNFWTLGETSDKKRNESVEKILSILKQESDDNQKSSLDYCIQRLVKGLLSSRKLSRRGFCVLLTEILYTYPSITTADVFEIANTEFGSPDDVRLHSSNLISWCFAFTAIINSGRLIRGKSPKEHELFIFNTLHQFGKSKQYLEIMVCELLAEAFKRKTVDPRSFVDAILPQLVLESPEDGQQTMYTLFLYLLFKVEAPDLQKIEFVREDRFDALKELIKQSTAYQPQIHPTLEELVRITSTRTPEEFGSFWKNVIEDGLFTAQNEKTYLGFDLVRMALSLSKPSMVPQVLSQQFLRQFVVALSNRKHKLHKAASGLADSIVESVNKSTDETYQLAIAESLINPPGSIGFDQLTNSKVLSNILLHFNKNAAEAWAEKLQVLFTTSNTDEDGSVDNVRKQCIRQLGSLVRNQHLVESKDLQRSILKFFFVHAYFTVTSSTKSVDHCSKTLDEQLSVEVRELMQAAFRKSLESVCRTGSKTTKDRMARELEESRMIIVYATVLIKSKKIQCYSESVAAAFGQVGPILNADVACPSDALQGVAKSFEMLQNICGLYVFDSPDEASAAVLEISEARNRAFKKLSSKSKKTDPAPFWADVVTDLIISLFPNSSKTYSTLLTSAFSEIAPHVTESSIEQIYEALISTSLEDESEDEDDEDKEMENKIVNDKDEASEEESSSDEESEEEADESQVDDFRSKVQLALGPAADVNDDEDDNDALDDAQMFQLDEALSEAFRSHFRGSKDAKLVNKSLTEFKLKCCDLVQVLLNKEIDLNLVLRIVPTIMVTSKSVFDIRPENAVLGNRAIKLIGDVVKIKSVSDRVAKEEVLEQLENIFESCLLICSRHPKMEYQKHLAALITWTVSTARKVDSEANFHVNRISIAIKDFFTKPSTHFSADVFVQIMSTDPGLAETILDIVEPYVKDEKIRLFVRTSGLSIYLAALKIVLKTNKAIIDTVEKEFTEILDKHLDVMDKVKPYFLNELLQIVAEVRGSKGQIELEAKGELATKLESVDKNVKKKLSKLAIKALNKLIKGTRASKRRLDPKSDEHETSADEVVKKKRKHLSSAKKRS